MFLPLLIFLFKLCDRKRLIAADSTSGNEARSERNTALKAINAAIVWSRRVVAAAC